MRKSKNRSKIYRTFHNRIFEDRKIGGAAVHQQQALVLINKGHATGQDVVKLAHHIRQTVADKFGVYLQPEVRFMGEKGEVNSEQAIS